MLYQESVLTLKGSAGCVWSHVGSQSDASDLSSWSMEAVATIEKRIDHPINLACDG